MFGKSLPPRHRVFAFAATFALTVALQLTASSAAFAQDSGAAPLGPLNPANWKMPSFKMPSFQNLMPGTDEKARITKKKDGLFQEVGQTASNSWKKTKDVFNPQKLNPTNFFTASSRTPASKTAEKKPGFFSSLFTPQPAEKESGTVTDFLRQDRPNP
ncbi:hypothetical protein LF1_18770 [Rubripirellula obstinata]|uniref:Uncharacterized protein n=2 Tax=Rubripirellula obstinata TaxID=406547 RepID=A0A5B1CHD3_9BACT|nr:hypothetical protein [Rubripirellula obstinata]KAA1259345.1 hypothetical protein LF1_18770 [Rubripirellula obstinata]